ncbi:hypothetical protein [Nocardia sp. NPDC057668]|uniref:hypothetical protein n=1 Tax=Nocardia sp. NPDC057668 TaxID=3346202 RepID=UPI003672D513
MPVMRRFWIEFDPGYSRALWWIGSYAGVTGYDEQHCLAMVADLLTDGAELPPVLHITPDVVVDDELPVSIRELGVTVWPGVWYPSMNLRYGPNFTRLPPWNSTRHPE